MADNDNLAFLSFFRSAYLFYTKNDKIRVIKDVKKLNEFMGSNERVYLLLKDYHLELLINGINSEVFTVLKGNIGHRKMVLVSKTNMLLIYKTTYIKGCTSIQEIGSIYL